MSLHMEGCSQRFFMNIFYVYEHWRPDLDLCFYVGKGKGKRAWRVEARNRVHAEVIAELAAKGMCVEVRLVASGLTELRAFIIERQRVAFWRKSGAALSNRTDGGEGWSGFIRPLGIKLSQSTREKLSKARLGMKFSHEHRKKLSSRKKGVKRKPFTEETRAKMRAASLLRETRKREKHGAELTRWSKIREDA